MKNILLLITLAFSFNTLCNELLYLEKLIVSEEEKEHKRLPITEGTRRKIVWENPKNPKKTPLAVLSLHGFSATRKEIEPLPQMLAKDLGANLYLNRLPAHGQKGDLFSGVSYQDWVKDVENDLKIAWQLGEQVVILAVSTGATLATWLVDKHPEKIKSVIYLSPLFGTADRRTEFLTMPILGDFLRKRMIGQYRSWKPSSEEEAMYWKYRYESSALTELVRLVKKVRRLPLREIATPSCWLYAPEDTVISVKKLKTAYKRWGGFKNITPVSTKKHIIAGKIMNPELTKPVLGLIHNNCFLRKS